MRIALYQPDIPQNTGTILRLAACLDLGVDVIGPAGFDLSDRALKRAALDYLAHVTLTRHESWEVYLRHKEASGGRLLLLTTHGRELYTDFKFAADDTLVFGRESAGVPTNVFNAVNHTLRIPLKPGTRSLNVAVATAMVAGEALRQTDGFPKVVIAD